MSQIYKRYVKTQESNTSPKKCKMTHKTEENLEDLKLKIERILNEYPISNKMCAQNISVVTNAEENTNLNYLTLHQNPTYQNNYSNSSNNNKNTSKHGNLIYLTGAPNTASNNSLFPKNNFDLSETDLQILLQNFYKLEGEEQQMLISHLKKLEENKPDVVEKLKKFVQVSSPEVDKNQKADVELNDLDDLDDILEETDKLLSDSESEDNCVVINVSQVLETTKTDKNREISGKSAENLVGNRKEESSTKVQKNNLLSKYMGNDVSVGNRLTSNKIDNLQKEIYHSAAEKKQRRKRKDNERTNCLNVNQEKSEQINFKQNNVPHKKRNNFEQNWYKIKSESIELEPAIDQEKQAKYFGYRNYKEMKQYLEMTGIYCDRNSYFSFSDNA